jgi:hypothetical protein
MESASHLLEFLILDPLLGGLDDDTVSFRPLASFKSSSKERTEKL